jgi:hypothetical protein
VSFECKVQSVVRIQGISFLGTSDIVIGRVVGIHIKSDYITDDEVCEVLNLLLNFPHPCPYLISLANLGVTLTYILIKIKIAVRCSEGSYTKQKVLHWKILLFGDC